MSLPSTSTRRMGMARLLASWRARMIWIGLGDGMGWPRSMGMLPRTPGAVGALAHRQPPPGGPMLGPPTNERGPPMRSTFAGILVALACASTPSLAQTYLGTAQPFAVLGATAVTCVVASAVTGDLGISPNGAGSITGYPVPPCTVSGTIHAADGVATTAQTDLVTAYNTLAALPCDANFTGQDLGSVGVLTPGVYCFN